MQHGVLITNRYVVYESICSHPASGFSGVDVKASGSSIPTVEERVNRDDSRSERGPPNRLDDVPLPKRSGRQLPNHVRARWHGIVATGRIAVNRASQFLRAILQALPPLVAKEQP